MNLPKEVTTVTTFSKIIGGLVFVLLPFIGFFLGMKYQEMSGDKPAYRDTLRIAISPQPSSSAATGEPTDVTTRAPLSLKLTVPASATYTLDGTPTDGDRGITITLPSGTVLSLCMGCQALIKECEADNACVTTSVEIGTLFASMYVLKDTPGKIAGYDLPTQGDPVTHIRTKNNTELSEEDAKTIEQILVSAKRIGPQGETALFSQ